MLRRRVRHLVEWVGQDFRRAVFRPVLSDVTAIEVASAPERVRDIHREVAAIGELVSATEEVVALAGAYEDHGILGQRFRNDMLHIALATVASVDVVVSWNFRHIVGSTRSSCSTA